VNPFSSTSRTGYKGLSGLEVDSYIEGKKGKKIMKPVGRGTSAGHMREFERGEAHYTQKWVV